jgi:hypothetical protein
VSSLTVSLSFMSFSCILLNCLLVMSYMCSKARSAKSEFLSQLVAVFLSDNFV